VLAAAAIAAASLGLGLRLAVDDCRFRCGLVRLGLHFGLAVAAAATVAAMSLWLAVGGWLAGERGREGIGVARVWSDALWAVRASRGVGRLFRGACHLLSFYCREYLNAMAC